MTTATVMLNMMKSVRNTPGEVYCSRQSSKDCIIAYILKYKHKSVYKVILSWAIVLI